MSLSRDVLVIVLTGVVLGLAFNALERSNRPPRGLPWIATPQVLESADEWISAGSSTGAEAEPEAAPMSEATPGTSPVATDASQGEPVARAESPAKPVPESRPPARAAEPAEADASAPPDVDVPAIPDVGRPLRVSLTTVAQFVSANAALIVDARDRDAFDEGHIPGALNLPYDETLLDPRLVGKLDPGARPIIVYCSGGTCESSRLLAESMMRDFGMHRVLVYEAGFPDWVAAGKPIARGSS